MTVVMRRSARGLVVDGQGRLVLIRRTKPGQPVCWTTPGGGVEPGDRTREDALRRELREELGAIALVGPQVFMTSTANAEGVSVQHFFVALQLEMDPAARTGAEWSDSSRGDYVIEHVPFDQVGEIDLKPKALAEWVNANRVALRAEAALLPQDAGQQRGGVVGPGVRSRDSADEPHR